MTDWVFTDPYFLTQLLAVTIVMIIGNLYFLAHFAHYADSFFGSSAATKGLLVSVFTLTTFLMCRLLGTCLHSVR